MQFMMIVKSSVDCEADKKPMMNSLLQSEIIRKNSEDEGSRN